MDVPTVKGNRDNLYIVYLDYNGILHKYPARNNLKKLIPEFMMYWFVREIVGIYDMPPMTMEDVLVRRIQFKLKDI